MVQTNKQEKQKKLSVLSNQINLMRLLLGSRLHNNTKKKKKNGKSGMSDDDDGDGEGEGWKSGDGEEVREVFVRFDGERSSFARWLRKKESSAKHIKPAAFLLLIHVV